MVRSPSETRRLDATVMLHNDGNRSAKPLLILITDSHLFYRQLKLNNELNNMSWRVRPDEILLEVGRLFGSKMGLQKLNLEVSARSTID